MRELKQSTAANLAVFMTDSTSHVSGATGLTLTIAASKDGGAFASITPTVTELANGWYALALTTTHTNTLGDLAIHITATGADPTDFASRVIALDKADAVRGGMSALPSSGTLAVNPTINATQSFNNTGQTTKLAATLAASDVTGNVATDLQTIKAQAIACAAGVTVLASVGTASASTAQTGDSFARIGATGSGLTSLAPAATALSAAQWTNARAALLDNLDAAVSTRSTYAGGAVASVTGNVGGNVAGSVGSVAAAGIATASFAAGTTLPRVTLVDTCTANTDMRGTNNALLAGGYTAPDNAAVAAIKAKTDQLTFTVSGHVDATASAGGNVTVGGYASGQDPATLVLDATATSHDAAGSIGNKINSAASAGDPWSTAEPGSYAAGTFGYLVSHSLATPTTPVTVTQDYLGTGRLAVENPPGNPVAGATVTAYLAADYAASGASASPVASTTTDAAGHWTLALPPAQYTVAFAYAGQRTTSTFYAR